MSSFSNNLKEGFEEGNQNEKNKKKQNNNQIIKNI